MGPVCGPRARRSASSPVGAGVYGTTGRLEKGYRLMGAELDGEYTAGRSRPAPPEGEVGRLHRQGGVPRSTARRSPRRSCARSPSRTTSRRATASPRYMTGGETDPHARRRAHRRPQGPRRRWSPRPARARRSASSCCSPTCRREHAVVGTELRVCYMNEDYPVQVAVAGSTPLFDPDDARMKG